MKHLMIAAATLALAACGGANEAEEPVAVDTNVAATTSTPMQTGTMATPEQIAGTYEMTEADGTLMRAELRADGTYAERDLQGTQLATGRWRQNGEQMCYDPEGAEAETCYTTTQPGADGTFEMRSAEGGGTTTVRKIAAGENGMAPANP